MKKEVTIRLDTDEVIALERCLSDRDAAEAFRFLKQLADKVRHAQFTA